MKFVVWPETHETNKTKVEKRKGKTETEQQ